MCAESSREEGGSEEEGGGEARREERKRAGADFSPVASGLRQFGFQPRLESQRRASEERQNRNGGGKSLCEGERTFLLAASLFPAQVSRALLFSALGKAGASHPSKSNQGVFFSAPRTEARSKKMAPIATSREEFGEQLIQLEATVVVWMRRGGLYLFYFSIPTGFRIQISWVVNLKGKMTTAN